MHLFINLLAWSGFILLLFLLSRVVPGKKLQGVPTPGSDGGWLYTLNGLNIFLIVILTTAVAEACRVSPLLYIRDNFLELLISANIFAFVMTAVLYLAGTRAGGYAYRGLKRMLRDMIIGLELNPRWWNVDLKLFSYRPSLTGLALINLSFAAYQYDKYGFLADSMLLYQSFTLIYILNYFQFEYGMLYTWDIIAERFGWMLVWGDYVLVPFFYSLPGWYLVDRTAPLPPAAAAGLVLMFLFGFWLFRGANEQKHRFKQNRTARIWGKTARTIDERLLVSGFWGIGRHLNYTGEICIYFAFVLTTGFDSIVPYLLPLWLTGLLVHRAWRDELRCRQKYGVSWDRYTKTARFRMIPFIY